MEVTFFALGTMNNIKIFNSENDGIIINHVMERVRQIENHMSAFVGTSDIVKIVTQKKDHYTPINPDTMKVLQHALWYYNNSEGTFDVTIRPLVELWGIGKKHTFIPQKEEIEKAMDRMGASKLSLNPYRMEAMLNIKEGAIDLGGIAKGYAADEVKQILLDNKVTDAIINLGGNIVTIGRRPSGERWSIGIQNPLEPRGTYLGLLETENETIVTSGSNEQFFIKDRVRYHHILDPRTGYPAQSSLLSVTVICRDSIDADALTTSLFVLGVEKGLALLKKVRAEAIFVSEDMQITYTKGLVGKFKVEEMKQEDRRNLYGCKKENICNKNL